MNDLNRNRIFFLAPTVALGLASLALRQYMMENCFDEKGLLIRGNLPGYLMAVLGIGFALYLLVMFRRLGGNGTYRDIFPASVVGGCLSIAAGAELFLSVRAELLPQTAPEKFLCFAAVAAMAVAGVCRILGKRPWFVFHGVLCLFFINRMITNYRGWSSDPQLQDYAYQMTACATLMLAAFHRTCCDAGLMSRKKLVVTCLVAVFCCLASLGDPSTPIFYLASGLWALGSVGNLARLPEDPEEESDAPAPEQPSETEELLRDVDRVLGEEA